MNSHTSTQKKRRNGGPNIELILVMVLVGLFANTGFLFGSNNDESKTSQKDLDEAEFKKLHAELVPKNETWKTIPWKTDLLAAQAMAAEQKKLIFIWSMDGHPLGCT